MEHPRPGACEEFQNASGLHSKIMTDYALIELLRTFFIFRPEALLSIPVEILQCRGQTVRSSRQSEYLPLYLIEELLVLSLTGIDTMRFINYDVLEVVEIVDMSHDTSYGGESNPAYLFAVK